MKTYIFITMSIAGIGGAPQYLYNKIRFLNDNGYQVFLFSGLDRQILISDFNKYRNQIIPAVMYSPSIFQHKEIDTTLTRISDLLGKIKGEVIIESTSIEAAQWGELLAKRLNAKNFIFNLQEKHNYSVSEIEFLKYKLKRKELAGITKSAINKMVQQPDLPYVPDMTFYAPCNNVVQDIPYPLPNIISEARLTIGSIGRLEKDFLLKILVQLKTFFNNNPNDKFNLLLIGGSSKRVISRIKKIFNNSPNVNLIITGYLYPIPKILLYGADLFISTAGSAQVSYNYRRPTMKVHPFTGEILGVLGHSFDPESGDFLADNNPSLDLISTIINIEKGEIQITYNDYNDKIDLENMKNEFERELKIETAWNDNDMEYYNIDLVKPIQSNKFYFYKILGHILGGDKFQKIIEILRRYK